MADVGKKEQGKVKGPYNQKTVKKRIEALFLDNLGKILVREQIQEAAKDPKTGKIPENWHQRVSELRTDEGYTILSWRNRGELNMSEYIMPSAKKRMVMKRVKISKQAWAKVLDRADYTCEWEDGGHKCGLKDGDIDPIGGGTVKLTPDHMKPHAMDPNTDPNDVNAWQALCGRHQVLKRNFWDHSTGKLNLHAIVQAAPEREKRKIFEFLKNYFNERGKINGKQESKT